MFARLSVVEYQINGVQQIRIQPMTFEDSSREVALQGGEAKSVPVIALEDQLDKAVAQCANAVVEDDGVGGH